MTCPSLCRLVRATVLTATALVLLSACCPCPGVLDAIGNAPIPNCFYCIDPENRDPFVRLAPHRSAPELQPKIATPTRPAMAY